MLTYLWKLMHKQGKSADKLSSIWKSILAYSKLYCKKLNNQKPIANTISITRRTTSCWVHNEIKKTSIYQSYCVFTPFFSKKNLIKSRIWHLQIWNLLPVFSTKGSNFGANRVTNSSASDCPFFSCKENPCTW